MSSKTERCLPLYEAKMMRQFTYRWATYAATRQGPRYAARRTARPAGAAPAALLGRPHCIGGFAEKLEIGDLQEAIFTF